MTMTTSRYGYLKRLSNRSVADARAAITDALKEEGFGVLTEIDVRETFKRKLGVDFREYVILGACNPPLANRALGQDLEIGLLLPCNVCIWADDGGATVAVVRPDAMFELAAEPALEPVAREANDRLRRALDRI
jgi:uncharacterized protein (DUF302 family)